MKRWICSALIISALMIAVGATAEDKQATAPQMTPEQMQAMEAAMMPGEHHEHMKALVGDFTYTMSWWMAPGTDPMTSEGKRSASMIMDGRYLQEDYTGDFMGMPFNGRGTLAYDNMGKQYISTWIDNMGTGVLTSHGNCSKDGGWEMKGESFDPMTGKMVTSRSTIKMTDTDTMVMNMYMPGPDGKEYKMMEMTCKRAK